MNCNILFDAGSTGFRVFILKGDFSSRYSIHPGPKIMGGLADPIREVSGKKIEDLDKTINKAVGLLEDIMKPDRYNSYKPFNWKKECNVKKVSVLATAGMRLAEQKSPDNALIAWKKIKNALANYFKKEFHKKKIPEIEARTITGEEEALFAWLNIYQSRKRGSDFGIVEMGGASLQIAFPCKKCLTSKTIFLGKEKEVKLFVYSFLGLGINSAIERFAKPMPIACKPLADSDPKWSPKDCAKGIEISAYGKMLDFLNYDDNGVLGKKTMIPIKKADIYPENNWILIGDFAKGDNIKKCCGTGSKSCSRPELSCFSAIYKEKILEKLGILFEKAVDESWTLGQFFCDYYNCFKPRPQDCEWLKDGCLSH